MHNLAEVHTAAIGGNLEQNETGCLWWWSVRIGMAVHSRGGRNIFAIVFTAIPHAQLAGLRQSRGNTWPGCCCTGLRRADFEFWHAPGPVQRRLLQVPTVHRPHLVGGLSSTACFCTGLQH